MVVDVCKKFFPQFTGWDDPRVSILIDDGAAFLAKKKNEYDVIIVDSSDPVGPAETLFTAEFYANLVCLWLSCTHTRAQHMCLHIFCMIHNAWHVGACDVYNCAHIYASSLT